MMIQIKLGNNLSRQTVMVDSSSTLREVLSNNGVDYSRGTVTLDGAALPAGSLDKTFDDFGITEVCYLSSIIKTDNA